MILWTLTIVVVSPHKQVLLPSLVGNLTSQALFDRVSLRPWKQGLFLSFINQFLFLRFRCSVIWCCVVAPSVSKDCSHSLKMKAFSQFHVPETICPVTCHHVTDDKSSSTQLPCGNLKFHGFVSKILSTVEFHNLFCHLMQEQPIFETSG